MCDDGWMREGESEEGRVIWARCQRTREFLANTFSCCYSRYDDCMAATCTRAANSTFSVTWVFLYPDTRVVVLGYPTHKKYPGISEYFEYYRVFEYLDIIPLDFSSISGYLLVWCLSISNTITYLSNLDTIPGHSTLSGTTRVPPQILVTPVPE